VPDEALGLMPGFFFFFFSFPPFPFFSPTQVRGIESGLCGLLTLKILAHELHKAEGAWEERQSLLRKSTGKVEMMIDLGERFQTATRSILNSVGRVRLPRILDVPAGNMRYSRLSPRDMVSQKIV
jgi:hypothetical protein